MNRFGGFMNLDILNFYCYDVMESFAFYLTKLFMQISYIAFQTSMLKKENT